MKKQEFNEKSVPAECITRMQEHPRIQREKKTVATMLRLHCREQHGGNDELCPNCAALHHYAMERLDKCIFQEGKTTCTKCPIHCYRPAMRQEIQEVMCYAGPRMTWRHPIMGLI